VPARQQSLSVGWCLGLRFTHKFLVNYGDKSIFVFDSITKKVA
jgi:hypothetical protein